MSRRAQQGLIIGISIAIIMIGAIGVGYYFYNENQKSITANTIAELERNLEEQGELTADQERQLEELAQVTCKEIQVPYDAQESYTEQEPYAEEVCEYKELIYRVDDIEYYPFNNGGCYATEEDCIDYNWYGGCSEKVEYCVGKNTQCSVTVNNLDNEKGYWSFDFNIREVGGGEIVDTLNAGYTIIPQNGQDFWVTESFEGREDADKDYYCTVDNINVPQKQECETVTKYEPVTKTRTVTKYRTETVCE